MNEFFQKHGRKLLNGGLVAAWFTAMGTAVASLIRSDKRQLKYYKKQDKIQDEQLSYWMNLNKKKES